MKLPQPSLRQIIASCELSHDAFSFHYRALKRRIDDAISGSTPASEWVIGPSRVGKTMLAEHLVRDYARTRVNGIRNIPVLLVKVPNPVSPKEIPKSVLEALGLPTPRGSSGELFLKMGRLLKAAGTKVVLFEEASHIVEVGAKMPPRAAGDWFKQLMDNLGITIILFGVPRLEKLYASNEQLRKRSQARREFHPYDSTRRDDYIAFAQCVMTYADMFKAAGREFEIPLETLVKHCFLLTGGLVGVLSAFMRHLAYELEGKAAGSISLEDCADALKGIEASGHPSHPAFRNENVIPAEMEQAHVHTLDEANLKRKELK